MTERYKTKQLRQVCFYDKEHIKGKTLPYVGMEDIESSSGNFVGTLTPRRVKSTSFYFTSEHVLFGRLRPYLNMQSSCCVLLKTYMFGTNWTYFNKCKLDVK